jgi:hypothetical protein
MGMEGFTEIFRCKLRFVVHFRLENEGEDESSKPAFTGFLE